MSHPFILIDGYNLMHAVGLARRSYGPGDLEVCRNRLLQQLSARLIPTVAERTTVVFDAFGSDNNSQRRHTQHGVIVLYAPAGTDADSELERIIAADSSPKQLLVVSSDHRLHRAARRRKARFVDSEVFWESLDSPSAGPDPHRAPKPLQTDMAFWLQEFAGVETGADDMAAAGDGVFDAEYLEDLESEFGG